MGCLVLDERTYPFAVLLGMAKLLLTICVWYAGFSRLTSSIFKMRFKSLLFVLMLLFKSLNIFIIAALEILVCELHRLSF